MTVSVPPQEVLYRKSPRRKLSPQERQEARTFYLCISPWLLGLLLFTAAPLVASLYLSFTEWNALSPPEWIGLENYQNMIRDPDFWQSLKVTTIYTLFSVPLRLLVALGLALLLNRATRGVGFFRTSFYLPAVVASVAAALIWRWMFNPRFGPINGILRSVFGVAGPAWFSDPQWALSAFVIMSLWNVGGEMLIFLAGLKGIPGSLYEAAEVDGANTVQKFFNITIPMLSSTIFFNLVLSVIGAFQTFDAAFVISTAQAGQFGSPAKSTLFYVLNIYKEGFADLNFGYASALAWVMLVILFFVTYWINRTSDTWVYSEAAK
jgi:multiple sugar transport system permease protein